MSELSPMPSQSVSSHSEGSSTNASELSPIPSISESSHSFGLYTKTSESSLCPSPSESLTNPERAHSSVWVAHPRSFRGGTCLPSFILQWDTLFPYSQFRNSNSSVSSMPSSKETSRVPRKVQLSSHPDLVAQFCTVSFDEGYDSPRIEPPSYQITVSAVEWTWRISGLPVSGHMLKSSHVTPFRATIERIELPASHAIL